MMIQASRRLSLHRVAKTRQPRKMELDLDFLLARPFTTVTASTGTICPESNTAVVQGPTSDSTPPHVKNQRPLYARNRPSMFTFATHLALAARVSTDAKQQPPPQPTQQQDEDTLKALLAQQQQQAIDIAAFAQVLQSLTSKLPAGSAARRAEHWMSSLETALLVQEQEQASTKRTAAAITTSSSPDDEASPSIKHWRQGTSQSSTIITSPVLTSSNLESLLQCYLVVIQAWASSDEDPVTTVVRAQRWLDQAKKHVLQSATTHLPSSSSSSSSPDFRRTFTQCYNAFLDLCSKGQKSDMDKNIMRTNAQKAEATLQEMIQEYHQSGMVHPDTESVNYVMRAIMRCKKDFDSAERTGLLLQQMETSLTNQDRLIIPPNAKSYCIWLTSLALVAQAKALKCRHLRDKLKQHSDDDGIRELKTLLDAVMFRTRGDLGGALVESMDPPNILLKAWAGMSGLHTHRFNAPMEAEKVFRNMVDWGREQGNPHLKPDSSSYLQVIRAWAHSGDSGSGEKANWWLEKQWEDYDQSQGDVSIMPTERTYYEAIRAWSSTGISYRADALLMDLLQRHKQYPNVASLKPSSELYASVIRTWLQTAETHPQGQNGQIGSLAMAVERLEDLMKEEQSTGDVTTTADLFHQILKCAAACASGSPQVVDMAVVALDLLRQSRHVVQPHAFAYVVEVVIEAHSWPEDDPLRAELLTRVVDDCKNDGLVSRRLVQALTNGPTYKTGWTKYESARLTHEFFPEWPIPASWTRNLRQETLRPKFGDFERVDHSIKKRAGPSAGRPHD